VFARAVERGRVFERGQPGGLGGGADVERVAHAIQHAGDIHAAKGPAQPQRRERVDLRKRPRHRDVRGFIHQLDPRFVIVAADEFGIGRVDHQQHRRRQPGMEAFQFAARDIGPGRVVGIGDEHDLGLGVDAFQRRVDVEGQILLRHGDRRRPRRQGGDRIHQEAVAAVDHLVARPGIGARQQSD